MKTIALTMACTLLLILPLMPQPVRAAGGDALRVTKQNVNVREGPDIASPAMLKVQKNTIVTERSRQGEWVAVEVPGEGREGWIQATFLARVTKNPEPAREKSPARTAKTDLPSSTPVAVPERNPQHDGPPMTTVANSASPKQPVTKVGIVDLQRIIDESVAGKNTKKYFSELAASTPAQDLTRIEQRLVRQVIEKLETIVKSYARKEGFTYVVDTSRGGVVFADERIDITVPVMKLYDQQSAADAVDRPRADSPVGASR